MNKNSLPGIPLTPSGLSVRVGSPPSFADRMAEMAYGRTASVDDPRNSSADWRDGYTAGRYTTEESGDAIENEYFDRGQPIHGTAWDSFQEWKIGFWAGRFTQTPEERAALLANAEVSNAR